MAESQSRYGIMSELNEKKVKEREHLASLEANLRKKELDFENQIEETESFLQYRKTNYKREHELWKKKKEIEMKMLQEETRRKVNKIQEDLETKEETYEEEFEDWLEEKTSELERLKKKKDNWVTEQKEAIETKKEVIKEIDAGINSLKEISKESSKE
jgi:hypothetical protein